MSRWGRGGSSEEGSPRDEPQGNPRDLYPTSDIRFVISEIAKFGERIDNLAEKVGDLKSSGKDIQERLVAIEKGVSFVKGAMWVFGGLFAIVLVIAGVVLRHAFGS